MSFGDIVWIGNFEKNDSMNSNEYTYKRKLTVQSVAALLLIFFGVIMLMFAIYMPPQGEIHPTVLFAFGEILIAAGAFMGVDLHFSLRHYQEWLKSQIERKEGKKDETV